MKRKNLLILSFAVVAVAVSLTALVGLMILHNAIEHPLTAGERFGPTIHAVSRILPLELSAEESESFQGLTGARIKPSNILVYDISSASAEEQIRARAIQGLMNREKPTLYLVSSEEDEFWLEQIDSKKTVIYELDDSAYPRIKYSNESRKQTYLAITLSGIYDAVPVLEAEEYLFDLTGLSDDELYDLMLEAFEDCNKQMISFRNRENPEHIDFVVKNKMFLSPLAVSEREFPFELEHTSEEEAEILEKIFAQMEPDCAMVGYNINSGIDGEYETINFLSEHGCFSIPVPNVPNLSFFSGLPREEPVHETQTSDIKLKDKVYVVLIMSDGDNLDLPYSKYESFLQEHTTPLAWSVSPLLNEFSPTMFEFYSSNLQQGDSFVAAPSGGGFGYPSKNRYLPAFVEHTDRFMQEMNLDYIWLLDAPIGGYSPQLVRMFSQISDGVFMEYVILRNYEDSVELYRDVPAVFSAGFVEKDGRIAERIIKSTPAEVPAFLFIGLEMRYNTPEHVDAEIAKLDSRYEAVSVPEFMELLKQAQPQSL